MIDIQTKLSTYSKELAPPDLLDHRAAVLDECARRCKQSLYTLCTHGLGYHEMTTRTHMGIMNCLMDSSPRKLIVCPRGGFKSSVCSVGFPIWSLIRNPNLRILIDSEVYVNSKNFLREIKGHLESELMTELFGSFRPEANWTEGSIIIKQRTKNLKEASITCSGIGAEKTGQHYDIVIMDDINSPNNSANEDQRKKVLDHLRYTQSILEPGGTLVLVGTRYHAKDAIGHVIANELEMSEDGSDFQ